MVLGIDLGTTYSVGAYVREDGEVEIIDNSEGKNQTPSVVMFDAEDGIIVGEVAKEHAVMCPDDVVAVIKNNMGNKAYRKNFNGVDYTPEMIASFIIRKVAQDAAASTGEQVEGVVVTVPAYFTNAKRKATEDAASIAGLPLIGMINEPTAAALSYAKKQKLDSGKILVYDLGGGTFDATVLHMEGSDKIEVLATGGLSNAGGRFFDQSIVDYVCAYMEEHYDIDLEEEEYKDELQELYLKAENAKIQLSKKSRAIIAMKIGTVKQNIAVTREQFESMIHKMYVRTESKVKEVLEEAGVAVEELDKVLMVGGSSRIPYIAEHISQLTGKEPSREVNPDEAVAAGAAIYASLKTENQEKVCFEDVCSHSIGVVVLNEEGIEENEIVIRRNSKIPVSEKKRFRTAIANQSMLQLTITEGEYQEMTDVTTIGSFEMELPKGLPERAPIWIVLTLNAYQLIHVSVEIPEQNFRKEYDIKRRANMDEETLQKVKGMLRDVEVS
jgi:molecular chaperone DnaK